MPQVAELHKPCSIHTLESASQPAFNSLGTWELWKVWLGRLLHSRACSTLRQLKLIHNHPKSCREMGEIPWRPWFRSRRFLPVAWCLSLCWICVGRTHKRERYWRACHVCNALNKYLMCTQLYAYAIVGERVNDLTQQQPSMLVSPLCKLFLLSAAQIWVTIVVSKKSHLKFHIFLRFLVIGLQICKLRNTEKQKNYIFVCWLSLWEFDLCKPAFNYKTSGVFCCVHKS
jgi:hypothetical protein